MKQICGMNVRREFRGPASTLASVVDENNQQHTAIVFHEQFHNHPALNDSLFIVLDFLQAPFVSGLADLLVHEPENGAFIFGTGPGSSIAELIRTATDLNIVTGARTGLEFMLKVGQVLVEASHAAQTYTVFSHGGLTPWRIVLKDNSDVSIIGYALPQVEMLDFQRDERMKPTEDSFRYCPPERIRSEPEDLSSDLFSLGLIAFELMTLTPIYDGTVDAIRQRAIRGDAGQQIYAARDIIPVQVAKILERTLQSNRETRFISGQDFLDAVQTLLDDPGIGGLPLADLLKKIKQQANQEIAPLPTNEQDFRTALLSRDKLLQSREMYDSQKATREEVVLGENIELDPQQSPPPEKMAQMFEAESVITTSGSSWRPVDRRPKGDGESIEITEEAPETPEISPSKPDRSRRGASDILKLLRESHRSLDMEAVNNTEQPKQDDADVKVPQFIKKISRSRKSESSSSGDVSTSDDSAINDDATAPQKVRSGVTPENYDSALDNDGPSDSTSDKTAVRPRNKVQKKQSLTSGAHKRAASATESDPIPSDSFETHPQANLNESTLLSSPRFAFAPFVVGNASVSRYIIHRNTGKDPMRFKAAADNTTAEFVSNLLTNRLIAIRTSFAGQILGWYRFKQGGKTFKGPDKMALINPKEAIELFCVENKLLWATIEVSGNRSVQYRTQVGTAVPLLSIIEHLVGLYGLENSNWKLEINDQEVGFHDILWDYIGDGGNSAPYLRLIRSEKNT